MKIASSQTDREINVNVSSTEGQTRHSGSVVRLVGRHFRAEKFVFGNMYLYTVPCVNKNTTYWYYILYQVFIRNFRHSLCEIIYRKKPS